MKKVVFVSLIVDERQLPQYELAARHAGLPESSITKMAQDMNLAITLPIEDERLGALRAALGEHNLTWFEREEHRYTQEELLQFPLLHMVIGSEARLFGLVERGIRFDFSKACSVCGTGAVQTSSLIAKASEFPKKRLVSWSSKAGFCFREELASKLGGTGFSGCELNDVLDRQGKCIGWRQLATRSTLPPMSSDTKGILVENQCPRCRRDGYFHDNEKPIQIAYRKSALHDIELTDFMQTWECFGNSRLNVGYAVGRVLVRPRVMEFLLENDVDRIQFDPVRFL